MLFTEICQRDDAQAFKKHGMVALTATDRRSRPTGWQKVPLSSSGGCEVENRQIGGGGDGREISRGGDGGR